MKKTLVLSFLLVVSTSLNSFAQNTTPPDRKAHFKEVNTSSPAAAGSGAPVVTLGTITTPVTSKEKVLAYPRLLPQALNCEVTGFDFAISANGKTWGPVTVKGAVFNEDVKNKIKEWEPAGTKISITNIQVKCSGTEATANPINLEYNH